MLVYLLQGIGYGLGLGVQPGPLQTFYISQTLHNGWRRTLPAVFAPLLSDGPIITLVLLVLNQMPPRLEQILYIVGGLFVLYLAFDTFIKFRDHEPAAPTVAPVRNTLLKAAVMNLLNPAPYIGWILVMGPALLRGWHEAPVNGVAMVVGFYGALIPTMSATIIVFGTVRHLGPKVSRALLGVAAVVLAFFGVYQVWLGVGGG